MVGPGGAPVESSLQFAGGLDIRLTRNVTAFAGVRFQAERPDVALAGPVGGVRFGF